MGSPGLSVTWRSDEDLTYSSATSGTLDRSLYSLPPSQLHPNQSPLSVQDLEVATPEGFNRRPYAEDALGRLCRVLRSHGDSSVAPASVVGHDRDVPLPREFGLPSEFGSVLADHKSLSMSRQADSSLEESVRDNYVDASVQLPDHKKSNSPPTIEHSGWSSVGHVDIVTVDNVNPNAFPNGSPPSAHIGPHGRGFVSTYKLAATRKADASVINISSASSSENIPQKRGFQPRLGASRASDLPHGSNGTHQTIDITSGSRVDPHTSTNDSSCIVVERPTETTTLYQKGKTAAPLPSSVPTRNTPPQQRPELDLRPPLLQATYAQMGTNTQVAAPTHPCVQFQTPTIFTQPDPLPYRLREPEREPINVLSKFSPPLSPGLNGLTPVRVEEIVRGWNRLDQSMKTLDLGQRVVDLTLKPIKDSTCPVGSEYFRLGSVAADRSLVPVDWILNENTLRHTVSELIVMLSKSQSRERALNQDLNRMRTTCQKLRVELNEARGRTSPAGQPRRDPLISPKPTIYVRVGKTSKRRTQDLRAPYIRERHDYGAVGDGRPRKAFDFTDYLYESDREIENDPPVLVRASHLRDMCDYVDESIER